MSDQFSCERELQQALPHVEGVLRYVARRYHLSEDEAADLASSVKLRLVEDDCRVLRAFEGRSQLRTYLTTVVTRLFLDERVKAWGKWRPSSEAKRLGPLAVSLERLIVREHLTVEEAIETICSRDPECERALLLALLERLPRRSAPRRYVDDTMLTDVPDDGPLPDAAVVDGEALETGRLARAALAEVLADVPARDRLLIELRYFQGTRVSDIAKVLREEPKSLYRRYEQLLGTLRRELETRGVSKATLADVFQDGLPDAPEDRPLRERARLVRLTDR